MTPAQGHDKTMANLLKLFHGNLLRLKAVYVLRGRPKPFPQQGSEVPKCGVYGFRTGNCKNGFRNVLCILVHGPLRFGPTSHVTSSRQPGAAISSAGAWF